MTRAEGIEGYRRAVEDLLLVMTETTEAVRDFHRNALDEMSALSEGKAFDLTESARSSLRLFQLRKEERDVFNRVDEAKVAALAAILAEKR